MQKIILGNIEKCYACMGALIDGLPYLFFAGEGRGRLQVFHGSHFSQSTVIWDGGGGTMSICALPGGNNSFLASRGFYSLYEAGKSTIELVKYSEHHFTHTTIANLPWLHRFDVVRGGDGKLYVVAATLAESKDSKEDWSRPGHLYWAEWADGAPLTFHELLGDFYQNHGFCKTNNVIYIASREGAFRITPPVEHGAKWQMEQMLSFPISDLAVYDIDKDGKEEISCIMPFHGDRFEVYRDGKCIYTYPVKNNFYHTATYGYIGGDPVFIGGARWETANLFLLRWRDGILAEEVDRGCGPSNAAVLNTQEGDILLAANRQIGQAAAYIFPRNGEAYGGV